MNLIHHVVVNIDILNELSTLVDRVKEFYIDNASKWKYQTKILIGVGQGGVQTSEIQFQSHQIYPENYLSMKNTFCTNLIIQESDCIFNHQCH